MPFGPGAAGESAGTSGESYGAILLPSAGSTAPTTATVLPVLRGIRFSGWIAPPDDDWLVILGDPGGGVVAAGRRGVIGVGALLAATSAAVLVIRVRRDRQLAIVAWRDGEEVGRYCSDPSQEPGAGDDVMSDPIGEDHAEDFAALCGHADATDDLAELLSEELDSDSVFESERLFRVLRMLGLPNWIVAAASLPRDIPTGPRARQLTRLRAGATGLAGVVENAIVRRARRRRPPPPVIADPPRSSMPGLEPWMF